MTGILNRNKRILYIASILYIAGIVLGVIFNNILPSLSPETVDEVTVLGYFKHNFAANLFLIFSMFTFGILTSILLLLNGFLVGLSSLQSINDHGNNLLYILTALIPHGIFEIPAMILSGSLGFKLLDFVYLKIRGIYSPKKHFFSDILFFTMMICLLTLLAALTEALLTPFLLKKLQ
ncbi:stage II sporulation protein M [Bacillus safensis]|uniref:stage II sporulation protein M n=1 Tax=Bacillus safensis TaxID=561879 RepID=UPI000B4355E4|nr:stage II sporulation protein M [Bacillus safensis]MED4993399.1 stage II sporulation protein M [Bacillus safensis]UDB46070.1 stage II sporulation protein M [Bacillus safensis]